MPISITEGGQLKNQFERGPRRMGGMRRFRDPCDADPDERVDFAGLLWHFLRGRVFLGFPESVLRDSWVVGKP
jgi:hypothetical protein